MKDSGQKSDGDQKPPHIPVGDPIWVESLMTDQEVEDQRRMHYKTYAKRFIRIADFATHQRWRYGMGASLTQSEIRNFNYNIDYLIKHFKPQP